MKRLPFPWAPMFGSAALLLCWTGIAHCQDAEVLLGRTCVSEAGWAPGTDCAAIGQVVRYHVRESGLSAVTAIRALSRRLHGPLCAVSRTWLCDLHEDARRPDGLGAPWLSPVPYLGMSRRDAWLAVLESAAVILGPTPPEPCTPEPRTWGSRADVARRIANGYRWLPSECGTTRNLFGRLLRRRS